MKPVEQTLFGANGDCFRACVASILECGIQDLPNFCSWKPETWFRQTARWLSDEFEQVDDLIRVACSDGETLSQSGNDLLKGIGIKDVDLNRQPDCLIILDVKTPRGRLHSVVSTFRYTGVEVELNIIHDPYPEAGEIWLEHAFPSFYAIVGCGQELWA